MLYSNFRNPKIKYIYYQRSQSGEKYLTYRRAKIRVKCDLSSETMQWRREWTKTFAVLRERKTEQNTHLEFCILWNYPLKVKHEEQQTAYLNHGLVADSMIKYTCFATHLYLGQVVLNQGYSLYSYVHLYVSEMNRSNDMKDEKEQLGFFF